MRAASMTNFLIPMIIGLYIIGFPAHALSKCDVISSLQRIQTSQHRLASEPAKIRASRDRDVLRRELQAITPLNISRALGSDISSDERSLIYAILDSAHMFQRAIEHNNTQLAVEIHLNPAFQRRLTQLDFLVSRFDCYVETPYGKQGTTRALKDIFATSMDRLSRWNVALTLAFLLITGGLTLAGIHKYRARKKRQRRRSRRHSIHLPIHYVARQKIERGTLIDISCNGVKLQHYGLAGKLGDTLDIWILDDWQKGTIAWVNTHYCGVNFVFPLLFSQVRTLCKIDRQNLSGPKTKTAPEPDAV